MHTHYTVTSQLVKKNTNNFINTGLIRTKQIASRFGC